MIPRSSRRKPRRQMWSYVRYTVVQSTFPVLTSVPDTADASDHEGAAKAIAKGLAAGHSKENPGYWLHTGGAGILCWETMRDDNKLGERSEREYNDWTAVQDLAGLPSDAFHKNVDDVVLSAGSDAVKTAILCPPTIYGE